MSQHYVGLTWDHPRGRAALEAATPIAAAEGVDIRWDVHSLEGFESAPIGELASRYDLIILDHPHLGDALASGCLLTMESVMGTDFVDDLATRAVGSSLTTYQSGGSTWALPLDAATQVSARRADLADAQVPTWEAVLDLSLEAPVALSLSGPHAYLTFASLCQSLGFPLERGEASQIVDPGIGARALDILAALAARMPVGSEHQNPIALLERMSTTDDLAYIPLVYGYVGYTDSAGNRPVTFGPSPLGPTGQVGSVIGGTGIAITRRAQVSDGLRRHIAWLLSDQTQAEFIPLHAGQPSVRAAWESPGVNASSSDFYRRTRSTIDSAWTRPRFAGFTRIQSELSEVIREAAVHRHLAGEVLATLTRLQNDAATCRTRKEIAQ